MSIPEIDSPLQESSPVKPKNLGEFLSGDGQFLDSYMIKNASGKNNPKVSFRDVAEVVDENPLFSGIDLDTKKNLVASIIWLGCDNRKLGVELVAKILQRPGESTIPRISRLQDDHMQYMLEIVQREKHIADGFTLVEERGNVSPRKPTAKDLF